MLGSVADVLRLTNDEAGGHIPVRLRAQVTLNCRFPSHQFSRRFRLGLRCQPNGRFRR
jgi:hypothetical protein